MSYWIKCFICFLCGEIKSLRDSKLAIFVWEYLRIIRDSRLSFLESLILAQSERWRRA